MSLAGRARITGHQAQTGTPGRGEVAGQGQLARLTRFLQGMSGVGLAFALLMALRPPVRAEANVGATTIWLLWWPLAPFLALALGRLWCAVCPFAGLSDLADAAAARLGVRRRAPGAVARRLIAVWLPVSLVLLGIAFLTLGLEMSGAMTLLVVGVFAAACLGLALLVKGRAWCRLACPLGATLGLYASLGAWTLRPRERSGVVGVVGGQPRIAPLKCPSLLNPRREITGSLCQVCLRCVDAGAAAFARQRPQLAQLDAPAAALAVALTGVLAADTVRMTPLFLSYVDLALGLAGPEAYRAAVALLPVLATLLAAAGAVLVGRLGGRDVRGAAAALVPVALAVQVGLSAQHLAGSGWPTLQGLLIEALPLPWEGHLPPTDAYTVVPWLKVVQLVPIGAAAALAFRRGTLPGRVAATGTAASFGGMFALPMSLAC